MLNRFALLACLCWCTVAGAADYRKETVASGLDHPWSVAFLPNGDLLVTERSGQLRRITDGNISEPIKGVPTVYGDSQGGLFDVVLHPEFATNQWIYLSYAAGNFDKNATTIARAKLAHDRLRDLEVIFAVEFKKAGAVHYGGRLAFLPDQTLLLTVGDGYNYHESAQDLSNQLGAIIRITDGGKLPPDNPFAKGADADPYIYSYGHRNPQGLAIDSATGTIYQHEHGPRGGDELNLIEAGKNYGWPAITYGVDYSGAQVSPYTEHPEMEQPLVYWKPSIANSGLAIYRGDMFPDWVGSALVGALVERSVRRVDLTQKDHPQETLFTEIGERIRDVREAPDGSVYLLTDSPDGQVIRIFR